MNIIIYSPQGNIHRAIQANVHSSVVSRLSKVLYLSSLTSSICRRGGRNPGIKNRTKVQRNINELVNFGSPNQHLSILKKVLRNPDLRKSDHLIY